MICRLAATPAELAGYCELRRQIFCEEQGLFETCDLDDIDQHAYPIVCLGDSQPGVLGVVRIWETAPGDWWGGRLGVARDQRTLATIGRQLIQTAVGTARAWGAFRFRATVQQANVAFFRRLHWSILEQMTVFGQPHQLMEAQLNRYAPTFQQRPDRPVAISSAIHVAA